MKTITVETTVNEHVQKVWELWTTPEHIMNWNFATPEWHCPSADHELKVDGKLSYTMASKDGSMSFDYQGTFTQVNQQDLLEYSLDDSRKVSIKFIEQDDSTKIIETFEVEDENSIDMQRQGWQAILDNFKKYAESV